jgi:hypothetical protein
MPPPQKLELDDAAQSLVEDLGRALRMGQPDDSKLRAVLDALAEVAPEAVVRVDAQMRHLLWDW